MKPHIRPKESRDAEAGMTPDEQTRLAQQQALAAEVVVHLVKELALDARVMEAVKTLKHAFDEINAWYGESAGLITGAVRQTTTFTVKPARPGDTRSPDPGSRADGTSGL